ncbi:type IV toxin-antitoxin system AbiEi family antitoxin [Brachybacterium phenoliresistens]|uniref:type IV toxin-antitoxin system AbiEi family antitoxin n=1 Tax=Brachybacterium phenoliresistens TaxID=396014 RepID=UPI0031DA7343
MFQYVEHMARFEHPDPAEALVDRARKSLEDLGVTARWERPRREAQDPRVSTGTLTIETGDVRHTFPAVASTGASIADLTLLPHDEQTILITEHVPPARAEKIAARGWGGYVDSAGNAHVRAPGLLLQVSGRRSTPSRTPPRSMAALTRAGQPVTFALLVTHGETKKNPTQRELMHLSGASLGTVNRVIRALREQRPPMIEVDGTLRLPGELEDAWIRAYASTRPAEESYTSSVWNSPQDLLDAPLPRGAVLGSELAAEEGGAPIRAGSALVHVPDEVRSDVIRLGRLRPQDGGWIRLRTAPWSVDLLADRRTAPRPLLRADLLLEDDPRLAEIASSLFGIAR